MAVNSYLGDLEGRMRLQRLWKLIPQMGKGGTSEWRWAVILDFGSFARRGLMVDRVSPAEACGR